MHKSATAADADTGWSEVVLNPARRIDLLSLTNGVLDDLGQTALPAGKYTQMRLVLVPNSGSGSNALANAIVPTGGVPVALTTPSGQQSGIKLNVDMDIAAGTVADFAIDFDACKSIVRRGNSGQYNLKPVVTVIPMVSNAGMRVVGYVDSSIALASTNVSIQSSGVPVKATVPDTTGKFELYPVPAGTYDLVVTAAGHATAVMTGVPVVTTSITYINSLTTKIVTPSSSVSSVNGTVNPASTTVRALQLLTGGPTVEVAWGLIDDSATPATFSFSLPTGAPVKTSYVANPVSIGFVSGGASGGNYTLEASYGGVPKTQAVDLSATVPLVTFTFP